MHRKLSRLFCSILLFILVGFGLAPVGASSANISRSYHSTDSVTNGSIVSLSTDQDGYVEAANNTNGSRILGVAVASNDSLMAFDSGNGLIQVATSGTVNTLVSTLNGSIKVGDQIAVSPFGGIGMKATPGSHVIGLAQSGFTTGTTGDDQEVKNKQGKTQTIHVGLVRLSIAVSTASQAVDNEHLSSLQKEAKSLTGRTVSTVRVVLSLVVAIAALFAIVTLIYASIYGSIVSIGRNPLAKYAIYHTLGSVVAMVTLLTVVSGLTIYLLLG